MKLYNSLSKKLEDFAPAGGEIKIYSCGPTVYDHLHIGNLRAFVTADTLRRSLQAAFPDAKITHVMNITDVDDKTISRSRQEYPDLEPKEALKKLTDKYTEVFLNDMRRIGNDVEALTITRATDEANLDAMRELITKLHKDGFAYIAEDGIYFSIGAYKKSGKTYGQLTPVTSDSTADARINNDEYDKESAHDFALWKLAKDDEPSWDFELDGQKLPGRPGWHIECSAMSERLLGKPFDIHTGGVDLKFPHHENEIAQSTAGSGEVYAKFFVHNEHMLIDGKKMAKSANNFFTLDDVVAKGFDPLALRLLFLQSSYRSQNHFSWDIMSAAQTRLQDLYSWADLRHQPSSETMPAELDERFRDTKQAILNSLADDMNTPVALASLGELVTFMQEKPIPPVDGQHSDGTLKSLDSVFGLKLDGRADITSEQKSLIRERETARKNQDWTKSDELRAELKKQGIEINDTANGSVWSRSS